MLEKTQVIDQKWDASLTAYPKKAAHVLSEQAELLKLDADEGYVRLCCPLHCTSFADLLFMLLFM